MKCVCSLVALRGERESGEGAGGEIKRHQATEYRC